MSKTGLRVVDKKLLPEGRTAGSVLWVMAIMMFLTVLAGAAALGLNDVASNLENSDHITIQIIEADPVQRDMQANAALAWLRNQPELLKVRRIGQDELRTMLEPWLGGGVLDADIPVPAMIEADLPATSRDRLDQLRAHIMRVAPAARIDRNAEWLGPLGKLVSALRWLAILLILLMAGAATIMIILVTRAALNTHHATIEILHLMGANDSQIAQLFGRRIALDSLIGSLAGFIAALFMLLIIADRLRALESELIGLAPLQFTSWLLLGLMPLGGIILAIVVARVTILEALNRLL